MNRDVLSRQMFRRGGAALPMQTGGMAPPPMPPGPPPEMAMGPPPMPPGPPPEAMGMEALQGESNMDPAMLEAILSSAAENFGDLETAEDYEQMINKLRGNEATMPERREELAEMVGEEDAQQTPESVLALVQPVFMMADVDQGIGGLAQGIMDEPVTGDMTEGIMSTVNLAGAQEAPAPVNFNQGGAVQYFAPNNPRVAGLGFDLEDYIEAFRRSFPGEDLNAALSNSGYSNNVVISPEENAQIDEQINAPSPAPSPASPLSSNASQGMIDYYQALQRTGSLPEDSEDSEVNPLMQGFKARQELYREAIPPALGAEQLAEREALAKSQNWLDVARMGLAMTQAGDRPESLVQAAARAAEQSNLIPNIAARAEKLQDLKLQGALEDRKLDIAALSAAEAAEAARLKTADSRKFQSGLVTIRDPDGNIVPGFEKTKVSESLIAQFGAKGYTAEIISTAEGSNVPVYQTFFNPKGGTVTIEGETHEPTVTVNVKQNPNLADALIAAGYLATTKPSSRDPSSKTQNYANPAGETTTFRGNNYGVIVTIDENDPNQADLIKHLTEVGYIKASALNPNDFSSSKKDYERLFPGSTEMEKAKFMLGDPELRELYATGELDAIPKYKNTSYSGAQIAGYLTEMMQDYYRPTQQQDEATGNIIFTSKLKPTPEALDAVARRSKIEGLQVPELTGREAKTVPVLKIDRVLLADKYGEGLFPADLDFSRVLGVRGSFNRAHAEIDSQLDQLLRGVGYKGDLFFEQPEQDTIDAVSSLRTLGTNIVRAGRSEIEGRLMKLDLDLLREEIRAFTPGEASSPQGAISQLEALQVRFGERLNNIYQIMANPSGRPEEQADAKKAQAQAESILGQITAAIYSLRRVTTPTGPAAGPAAGPTGSILSKRSNTVKTLGD